MSLFLPPAALTLDIYPNGELEFVVQEEDGLRTRLACREKESAIHVAIEAHEGNERTFIARVNGSPATPGLDGVIEVNV